MKTIYDRILEEECNVIDSKSQDLREIKDIEKSEILYKRTRGNKNLMIGNVITTKEFITYEKKVINQKLP